MVRIQLRRPRQFQDSTAVVQRTVNPWVVGSIPTLGALRTTKKRMNKKTEQLGMSPSTASGRLVKDILWSMICEIGKDACCKCGFKMARETFSIEHVVPWLDSDDPVGKFFDLKNIAFSHIKCNVAAARKQRKTCGSVAEYRRGCKCSLCMKASATQRKQNYKPELRRANYLANGC